MQAKFSMERLEPNLAIPYTDNEEPILTKLLVEKLEPICAKSKMERLEPNLAIP
jgi:hypothetical protein